MIRKIIAAILNIKGDFQNLFIFNEFDELTGKSRSGIITLTVILTLTFLALGFAIGGINYLGEKMDNPFTNWVNLEIKPSYRSKVANIVQTMEEDSMKSKYMLNNIGQYNIEFQPMIDQEDGEEYPMKLRTIDLDDNILTEILHSQKGNVIHGYNHVPGSEMDIDRCGIIIKEAALIGLGYENTEDVKKVALKLDNFVIFPEVTSVVRELPNLADFVISPHFYKLLITAYSETNFIQTSSANQFEILTTERNENAIDKEVRDKLSNFNVASLGFDSIETVAGKMQTIATVYFNEYYNFNKLDTIYQVLADNGELKYNRYTRWECNVGRDYNIDDPYYLQFNFNQLDNVRDFKNYLDKKYQVVISMDQVEQKENFALVSRLTGFISLILFGFSILSIVFYVNSLLRTHLEKIKMNLGTLKAFGLNNKFLISSYLKIILTFIGISIVIGFAICAIWDVLEGRIFENSYFDVFNWKILAAIVVLVVTALFTSQRTISKTLMKTPGDLIYNR